MTISSPELIVASESFNPSLFCSFLMCNHCFLNQPVISSGTVRTGGDQETLDCFLSCVVQLWNKNVPVWLPAPLPQARFLLPCRIHCTHWEHGALHYPQELDSKNTKAPCFTAAQWVGPTWNKASAVSFCMVTSSHFRASIASQSQVVADAITSFIISGIFFYSFSLCLPEYW